MNQKLIFLLVISLIYSTKSKLTKTDWVNKLEALAKQPSHYRNKYPYNLLYWDGSSWWCDCSNLMKALFNGRNINDKRKGSYQNILADPKDVTEYGLFSQCSDISSNFNKLKSGEPRLLYKQGHIGSYIGKELKVSQGTVNSIECTGALGGGIKYTYVDGNGNRLVAKGGRSLGRWAQNGKPTIWVTY
jgi:hypothetical protein